MVFKLQWILGYTMNNSIVKHIEVSTVWIFTPRLPWTLVGFVTHYQQFVNGLSEIQPLSTFH